MKLRKGITLVELVLSLALVSIIIQSIYSIYFTSEISYAKSTNKGFAQQDIRLVSDFVKNELKYITDFSLEDEYGGTYYSLKVEELEGKKVLIKTKHEYTGDGTEANKDDVTVNTIINEIYGNWDEFDIANTKSGILTLNLNQEEGSGKRSSNYQISVDINLLNNESLNKHISSINLLNGDIIYYRNNKLDSITRGIDINDPTKSDSQDKIVTITFDSQGGHPNPSSVTGKSGSIFNLPSINLERDGYIFKGWYTEPDGNGEFYGGNNLVFPDEDITLYAKWVEREDIPEVLLGNVIEIDEKIPSRSNGRYIIKKNTNVSVKIELIGYNAEVHRNKVTVKVGNALQSISEDGTFTISVKGQGNDTQVDVDITIRTDGYNDLKKTYFFITANK